VTSRVFVFLSSDHQHDADIKTVERLHRDMDRTNNQLAVVLEDLTNVEIIHDSKQRELIRQQDSCFTDESAIKVCLGYYLRIVSYSHKQCRCV